MSVAFLGGHHGGPGPVPKNPKTRFAPTAVRAPVVPKGTDALEINNGRVPELTHKNNHLEEVGNRATNKDVPSV